MKITPVNYDLEFEPNMEQATFRGSEKLTARADAPTNKITIDAAELRINSCHVMYKGQRIGARATTDEKSEKMHVTLDKKINGTFILEVGFTGTLNDRLLGFYRSKYTESKKTRFIATTQFEAADARRAFPCWDRPDAKATFEITIVAQSNYMAVSNMPVVSKKKTGKKTRHQFGITPVMSTYLVYLGVGEFEYISTKSQKTQIRVITTRGNKRRAKFALDMGKKLLKAYEGYFGIKYPLPKLDLLAIPDFAAGAMENWGAITFRETILLYDPATSSARTKQFIAEVISHEIAHQWFGNLVTMQWWNELWLNESFATFMATKFVNQFYPQWELWDQFIEDAMNAAMSLDSLKSTHPIDVKVNSPAQIREIFDAISYDKGGCILRMLEHYVGESSFKKGLKKYLTRFKYQNATGDDLWSAIGSASGKPVKSMVNSWLKQSGFPLVSVTQKDAGIKIQQRRFLLEKGRGQQKAAWYIPIDISAGAKMQKSLLTAKTKNIRVAKNAPVILDPKRMGFYRVQYDDGMLLDLKRMVDEKKIPYTSRWAIQNDLFALCVSGDRSVNDYLDFTDAYFDEDRYMVSVNVAGNLYSLFMITFWDSTNEQIKIYAINYFRRLLYRIGWKSEKHTDALLRSFAISALVRLGDARVAAQTQELFAKFLKKPDSLSPDLREPVYSAIAWNGNAQTHAQITALYKKAGTQEEKMRFLSALCSFKDKKLLLKSLDFSQTAHVRSQNMHVPIIRVAANPYGRDILWPWLQSNWTALGKKVGHGNPLFNRIVSSISQVADESMEKEIRVFFKRNPVPGTQRTLEQTLERIRIRARLAASIRKDMTPR